MIAIPNMDKPKRCDDCWALDDKYDYPMCLITQEQRGYDFNAMTRVMDFCPLIEIDDELIKKLQESAIVIKAVFNRLKKLVNNSDELKTELMGTNPNLTIFDECVESVEK